MSLVANSETDPNPDQDIVSDPDLDLISGPDPVSEHCLHPCNAQACIRRQREQHGI